MVSQVVQGIQELQKYCFELTRLTFDKYACTICHDKLPFYRMFTFIRKHFRFSNKRDYVKWIKSLKPGTSFSNLNEGARNINRSKISAFDFYIDDIRNFYYLAVKFVRQAEFIIYSSVLSTYVYSVSIYKKFHNSTEYNSNKIYNV